MTNTAEVFEVEDGYEVSAQNTDGKVFVDSFVVEEDAFENIAGHVQEDGRVAYDAKEGCKFMLEGDQRVGSRIGYLHCVEEPQVENYEIPYGEPRYTFNEMVSELGVPDTDEAAGEFCYLPFVALDVQYDEEENETEVEGVKINGKWYNLVPR